MSDQHLTDVVGEDVNLAPEAQDTASAAPQDSQQDSQTGGASDGEPGSQSNDRVVPLAALHEERNRRKELAAEINRLREEQARRDAILEHRLQAIAQQRQEASLPSFEENPVAHLHHGQQQLQQTVQATAQQLQSWQQQQAQQQMLQQLAAGVQQAEAGFVAQTPDYYDAVTHLRNQRAQELMADGLDEVRAAQVAQQELAQLALARAQSGQNPAEVAYRIAKARGYAAKAPQAAGAASAQERLQAQQKGVAAAKSLGSGGAPSGTKMTAEQLASMSDEEFAELTAGNKWQKLMGG